MSYHTYPNFSNIDRRIESFTNYPKILKPIISTLALNGFFYLNERDIVYCFCCGIAFNNFLLTTTPEYLRALHIVNKFDCEFNLDKPFTNFFLKHLALIELETKTNFFGKFLQKLAINDDVLCNHFNTIKNNINNLLKNHGFGHQTIFYFTNETCSSLILEKDINQTNVLKCSTLKIPPGSYYNHIEQTAQKEAFYTKLVF